MNSSEKPLERALSKSLPSRLVPKTKTATISAEEEEDESSSRNAKKRGIMRVRTLAESLGSDITLQNNSSRHQSAHLMRRCNSCIAVPMSVEFNHVDIREYDVVVGDNPSCSDGAPISLDWGYSDSLKDVSVDLFEKERNGSRRKRDQLRMNAGTRHSILMEKWDFSVLSIMEASKVTDAARKQRLNTARKSLDAIRKRELIKRTIQPIINLLKWLNPRRKKKINNKNEHPCLESSMPHATSPASSGEEEGSSALVRTRSTMKLSDLDDKNPSSPNSKDSANCCCCPSVTDSANRTQYHIKNNEIEEALHSRLHYDKCPGRSIQLTEHFVPPSFTVSSH